MVVTSSPTDLDEIDVPTTTVRGRPATAQSGGVPGRLTLGWVEDGLLHDAIAIGMTEAELSAFVDSLTVHADPATGFDAPVGGVLSESDSLTTEHPSAWVADYRAPTADRTRSSPRTRDRRRSSPGSAGNSGMEASWSGTSRATTPRWR